MLTGDEVLDPVLRYTFRDTPGSWIYYFSNTNNKGLHLGYMVPFVTNRADNPLYLVYAYETLCFLTLAFV